MAGQNSSREFNFWPGFVDAMGNLVLVLIFVIVVFTFALFYFASQLAKQTITNANLECEVPMTISNAERATLAAHRLQTSGGAAGDTGIPLNGASRLEKLTVIERQASQLTPVDQGLPVVISGKGGAVVLSFAPGVADLSAKEKEALGAALGGGSLATWNVELTAEPAEQSPSEGRRLAYYRIAAIRNYLVASGVRHNQIDMIIGDPAPEGTPRSRVVIRLGTKSTP